MDDDDIEKITVPAAEVVANANVEPFVLDSDDFVVGIMVVAVVKDGRGNTGIHVKFTEDFDWIQRLGVTTAMAGVELETNVREYLGRAED